jgi:hypothetical protein
MLRRRSFMKLSAGTVQACGERCWTPHLLSAAIRPVGWVRRDAYEAKVWVGWRWLRYRQTADRVALDCARYPEILRGELEKLAHNALRAALITQ